MIDQWGKGAKYWDHAWNPVVGCRPVSEGCENCYASALCKRFDMNGDGEFEPTGKKTFRPPKSGVVFIGNMTDTFGEWNVEAKIFEWLYDTSSLEAENLVLTKRTERLARIIPQCWNPSIHIGMTAENQERYDERIGDFRTVYQTGFPWLSAEPLLGKIDMRLQYIATEDLPFQWVVVGAESGPNRRPCKLEWVESIVEQCISRGIKVFVKQLDIDGKLVTDINKFPEHLQIRQVPWTMKGGKQ